MHEEKNKEVNWEEQVMKFEVEGLSEEETREVRKIFQRFLKKYKENPDRETVEWLSEQLQEELPEKSKEEIYKMAEEIAESIEAYNKDLKNLNQSCKKGMTKESWFAEKVQDSAKGMAVNQFGDYLYEIDQNFVQSNMQMARTVLRADGEINQNVNLDGFMAEQFHVNNFNAKAVLEKSPYRARVCVPENGEYGKNSVDVVIDNIKTGKKGIERYQFKFGKDGQSTITLLKKGNYNNQRLVVPQEQLAEVQGAFPDKTVSDCIGGTEKTSIRSDSVTKEQMKEMQTKLQEHGISPKAGWNSYQTKELALNIGKQAGQAGIQAAFLGIGLNLAGKVFSGEKVEADEVVKTALETGSDTCVKAAAGGALKAASEKGILSIIPPGTPGGIIAKVACVGIENIKILWKVTKGELTMSEAMEHMGRTSVSMYAGLSAGAIGAGIGASVLSWIPLAGPLIGGVIGGIVGYTAGSKVGEKIFEGAKKVVKTGVKIVKGIVEGVKNVFTGVKDLLFGWL